MSCSARLGLFCLLGAVAASTGGDLSAPVAVLTDGNFEDALLDTEKRVWMIEFYAPVRLPACAVPCRSVPYQTITWHAMRHCHAIQSTYKAKPYDASLCHTMRANRTTQMHTQRQGNASIHTAQYTLHTLHYMLYTAHCPLYAIRHRALAALVECL